MSAADAAPGSRQGLAGGADSSSSGSSTSRAAAQTTPQRTAPAGKDSAAVRDAAGRAVGQAASEPAEADVGQHPDLEQTAHHHAQSSDGDGAMQVHKYTALSLDADFLELYSYHS